MIFGPKPPPTNGATTRTCDSSRPSMRGQAVADRNRRLRRVPDRQLFGTGDPTARRRARFSMAADAPRSYRKRRAMTTMRRGARRCVVALRLHARAPRRSTPDRSCTRGAPCWRAPPRDPRPRRAARRRRRRRAAHPRRCSGSRRRSSRSARRRSAPCPAPSGSCVRALNTSPAIGGGGTSSGAGRQ